MNSRKLIVSHRLAFLCVWPASELRVLRINVLRFQLAAGRIYSISEGAISISPSPARSSSLCICTFRAGQIHIYVLVIRLPDWHLFIALDRLFILKRAGLM